MASVKYWLWLDRCAGLKKRTALRLLERFGSPEAIYNAPAANLEQEGLAFLEQSALADKDLSAAEQILRACDRLGHRILSLGDSDYPERLKNIYDPPLVLYVRGQLPAMDEEVAIAVVGTRNCTPYGEISAQRLAYQVTRGGGLVISGLARGVDTAAHLGALKAGGKTVAVLGCGLDVVFPPQNKELYEDIAASGALVSEYPPGTPALGAHFPQRNRIMSGLALGVLVAEAPERSGALITARLAMEQGRDVFAVPGNIDAPKSAGCNRLIQDGALLATSGWDILREYAMLYPNRVESRRESLRDQEERVVPEEKTEPPREKATKKVIDKTGNNQYIDLLEQDGRFSEDEKQILLALQEKNLQVDELIDKTQIPAPQALSALTMLEIQGLVAQLSGKRFEAKVRVRQAED